MQPTSTSKARTITISGMTGDDCVQQVKAALRNVSGVTTEEVTVGQAKINIAYPAAYAAACTAVTSAGFKVTEVPASSAPAEPSMGAQELSSEGGGGAIGTIPMADSTKPFTNVATLIVEAKPATPVTA